MLNCTIYSIRRITVPKCLCDVNSGGLVRVVVMPRKVNAVVENFSKMLLHSMFLPEYICN